MGSTCRPSLEYTKELNDHLFIFHILAIDFKQNSGTGFQMVHENLCKKWQFLEVIAGWVRTGFPRSISFLLKGISISFELLEAGTILVNKYFI